MLGIIVCTHSHFASGLKDAVTMILGEQEDFDVVELKEKDDITEYSNKVKAIAKRYEESNKKYVVFVDILGATPFNASALALNNSDTRIITGVNLTLLLEVIVQRNDYNDYDALLSNALDSAKENMKIVNIKDMFK